MRKLVNYIILSIMGLFLPFVVDAASASVGLNCPSAAAVNTTISCNITVSSDVKVNGLVLNYSFTGAEYVSFTPSAGFTINYSSDKGFNIGNNAGKSGSYTIGVLKVKVTSAATIILKNIDVSDTNFESYSPNNKSATVRLKSTNANLGSLSLTGGTLSPSFNVNVVNYTATINASSVIINATKGVNTQTITGAGKKTLKYGKNTFKVTVTSEAGNSKTYTIVITRNDDRKKDNYLKSLSVDKGNISFKRDTLNYSVNVGKDVSSIKVSAVLNDSTAKFVNGFGPRTVNLKYGVNNVLVKVQAQNEEVRTYTIKVTRQDDRSSNNKLSSINLSEGKINFNSDVTNYNVSVPYTTSKIDVTATAADSKSKVVVNSPNLVVGNNVITITVTAENGQSKVYKINVKRLEEQATLSDNNNISSIDILGHGIEFNQDTNEYDVSIGDEYALVIDVLLEDPSAKYVIEGNEDLKDGSVIKITSTSESGEVKEYKLNIKKALVEAPVNKSGNGLIPGLIGFVLGLFTMFITMMLLNKMKGKKPALATVSNAPVVKTNTEKVVAPVVAPTPKPAPVVAPVSKPAPAVESVKKEEVKSTIPQPPKPATAQAAQPLKEVVSQQPAPAPKPAPVVATKPALVQQEAPKKPVMQEANVSQPTSKTVNVIPDNK